MANKPYVVNGLHNHAPLNGQKAAPPLAEVAAWEVPAQASVEARAVSDVALPVAAGLVNPFNRSSLP